MAVFLAPGVFGVGGQLLTTGGLPLNGGLVNTYAAGTSTPQATFTTSAGNVQNQNPIVLGSDGRFPAEVWLTGGVAYKFVVTDSLGVSVPNAGGDNLYGINDPAAPGSASQFYPLTSVAGTANAITAAAPQALSSLAANQLFTIIPALANTGATAIVITPSGGSALPSKSIFSDGAACVGGELKAGVPVDLLYDGTQLNILGRRFFKQPTRQVFTSGSGATYTTPAGATRINVRLRGGGGGGGGASANSGAAGVATTFSTLTANGGGGGGAVGTAGGTGGTSTGGDINISGGAGQGGGNMSTTSALAAGGQGGGDGGGGGGAQGVDGTGGSGGTGGGGGGGGGTAGGTSGAGGGGGGYCEKLFTAPSATYTYTVGTGGNGGVAGGHAGGNGGTGIIIVDEYYN